MKRQNKIIICTPQFKLYKTYVLTVKNWEGLQRHSCVSLSRLKTQTIFTTVTDWMFASPHPPKIRVKILTPKAVVLGGGAFGGDEVTGAEPSRTRLVPLEEEARQFALALSPPSGEDTRHIYKPGSGSSTDTRSASALILDSLQNSET